MKNSNPSPKIEPEYLPGYIEAKFIKCGKQNCKCSTGDLHGPYFYRVIWANNERLRTYIRQKNVPEVAQACENYRLLQNQLREGRAAFKQLLARARELRTYFGAA